MLGEEITRKMLEYMLEEKFIKIRPKWLKGVCDLPLELDGYCKKINVAFEYNGIQHYRFIKRFHKTMIGFNHRKKNDEMKKKLCEKNKVYLIIVPYTIKFKNIQQFLIQKLLESNIPILKKELINYKTLNLQLDNNIKYFEQCVEMAKRKNGIVLSDNYYKSSIHIYIQCEKKHIWKIRPSDLKSGSWCPTCSNISQRLGIDKIKEKVDELGGKCLSFEYKSNKQKLHFQCKCTYKFWMRANDVLSGHWCPKCGKSMKGSIEQMRLLAKKRNGECLSNAYINSVTKLKWKCEKGHIWDAVPSSITVGRWCPSCVNKNRTILDMHKLAFEKRCKCLSNLYINCKTELEWECEKGHRWKATPTRMQNKKHWCSKCRGKNKYDLQHMQKIASDMDGKCLSNKYINIIAKLEWECKNGHRFSKTPRSMINKPHCTECKKFN